MANGLARLKIEDFIECITSVRREYGDMGKYIPMRQLIQIAIHRPARRFYISPEEATRQINNIQRGRGVKIRSTEKKQMYADIYKKYLEAVFDSELMEYKYNLIERIVNSEAPRFYINPNEATRQIREYYRKIKKENKK